VDSFSRVLGDVRGSGRCEPSAYVWRVVFGVSRAITGVAENAVERQWQDAEGRSSVELRCELSADVAEPGAELERRARLLCVMCGIKLAGSPTFRRVG
jgi:hypothetical protein